MDDEAYNIGLYISPWKIPRGDSTHLTLRHVLFEAAFWWWFVGSWVGFGLVMVFWTAGRTTRAVAWVYRKARKASAGHAAAPLPNVTALDPTLARPPPIARADCCRGERRAVCGRGLRSFYTAGSTWKSLARALRSRACPKNLRGFASSSFPTFTSAPS